MTNPTVPDGPDTELAAISADLDDLHTEACSVAMRSEGSVTAAAEEVRDDVASIRDRLRAVLARPAAGRDLTAQDVGDAIRQWNVVPGEPHRDAFIADYLNGIARPADNTAVQGWGDVESADFIERARAATAVGSFTAQFDHVYDPSGDLVCESADHSTAVRIAAALSAAPADDTAAPDPRPQLRSVVAELSGLLDRAMNHGIGVEYIAQRRETYMSDLRRAEEAVADDSAAADRITAVKLLLDATTDPMDRAEAETHLDILGVTRAEVDEAKRLTAGQPVRDSQGRES